MTTQQLNQTSVTQKSAIPKIVIVGGGAGGLELVTRLGNRFGKKKQVEIILIDQKLTHIWKPLLHEVASGTLATDQHEVHYYSHAQKNYYTFCYGRLVDIDRQHQQIQLSELASPTGQALLPARTIDYDYLILALGSKGNDFGIKGAIRHSIFLDSREQADYLHRQILEQYLARQVLCEDTTAQQMIHVSIIGAGATGVELSAELATATKSYIKAGLNANINLQINLIEASARILPVLPETVADKATQQLKELGVDVLTSTKVVEIQENCIMLGNQKTLKSDVTVWCAGIKAPDVLKNIAGLQTNKINQLLVDGHLQTTKDQRIFAFGDCASYTPIGSTQAVPPRAQVANQQAIFLEKLLLAKLNHQPLPTFKFVDKGTLISLSELQAVGRLLGGVRVYGYVAGMMYLSLYRLHQAVILGLPKTGLSVIKDLLSKGSQSKIKLH